MRAPRCLRLFTCSVVAYNLPGGASAQLGSTDLNGCFLTSALLFGNTTISNVPTSSADSASSSFSVSQDSSALPPIPATTMPTPTLSTTTSSPLSTTGPPILFSTPISSVLTTTTSAILSRTSTSAATTTTQLPPESTPFRVTVSGFDARLIARTVSYIAFTNDDAVLVSDELIAAIFVLRDDGQLLTGDATVGTQTNTGSIPLMRFSGTQSSGVTWSLNGSTLVFGDNLPFSALADCQLYVDFPGSQPPAGAVQLALTPEFVPVTSSSSTTVPTSTSQVASTTQSTGGATTSIVESASSTIAAAVSTLTTTSVAVNSPSSTKTLPASSQASQTTSLSLTTINPSTPASSSTPAIFSSVQISIPTSASVPHTSATTSAPFSSTTVAQSPSTSKPTTQAAISSTTAQTSSSSPFTSAGTSTTLPIIVSSSVATSSTQTSKASTVSSTPVSTLQSSTTASPPSVTSTLTSSTRTIASGTSSSSTTSSTPYPAKRGLPYANGTTLKFYPPPSPYINWAYNYFSLPNNTDKPPSMAPYDYPTLPFRFIPMLFNNAAGSTSDWARNANYSIQHYGSDAVFSFNEPDLVASGSAGMSVAASVQAYATYIQPFAGRVKLGAPAVTQNGLGYLSQFLGNASQQGFTVDFINVHWYGFARISDFTTFVQQVYTLSRQFTPTLKSSFTNTTAPNATLPIWITEIGMDKNFYGISDVSQFLKNVTMYLDGLNHIERYAWFGNYAEGYANYDGYQSTTDPATNMLLNVDGSGRSVLGDIYYSYHNGTMG